MGLKKNLPAQKVTKFPIIRPKPDLTVKLNEFNHHKPF